MKKLITGFALLSLFAACKKDKIEDITVKPSEGNTIQLQGIAAGEPGSSAGNAVFVDFSKDKATTAKRSSWDLAFYTGNQSRVLINNMTGATAYVTNKTDLNAVTAADTIGVKVSFDFTDPQSSDYNLIDDINGDLSKTVIPEINGSNDKVVIIDRGTGAGTAKRALIKLKIKKSGADYIVEYDQLDGSSSKTATVSIDNDYNFSYFSFDDGAVKVEPQKREWDICWTASMYQTNMGGGFVPYVFSDLIIINSLNNIQVVEKNYDTEEAATQAYADYKLANTQSETFSSDKWIIGSNWRRTATPGSTTPAGTIKTKFYIVKDTDGNFYKLKFISFSEDDGGQRGKPEIQYTLVQ